MKLMSSVLAGLLLIGCTGSLKPEAVYAETRTESSIEAFQSIELEVAEKTEVKDSNYLKVNMKLPELKGGGQKTEELNNEIEGKILKRVHEVEEGMADYFEKNKNPVPDAPYELSSTYSVTENNKQLLCLDVEYYEYLGGAHGMTYRMSYTIDKQSEKIVDLKEMFKDDYDYKGKINEEIKKQIEKEPKKYFDSSDKFQGIDDNQNFYIKDGNLIIYFDLYDIAPYVAGFPEFVMPDEIVQDNLKYEI